MKNKILKHCGILLLPLLVKYVLFLFFVDYDVYNASDLREDILFYVIILLLLHTKLFQNKALKALLLFGYVLYFVLETTSYLAVSSTFSSSYMYLLIDAGFEELKEFADGYFNWSILLVFISYLILFFALRRNTYSLRIKNTNAIGFGISFLILIFLKMTGLIESNAYHNVVRGTYGYYSLQKNMKLAVSLNSEDIKITSENEVMVFVLGESTDRQHMQLYGYDRETTPKLNAIRDELLVYDNVISTEVFTLKAMPKIISTYNSSNSSDELIDVVNLFNSAGFDTYWLSNQRPISYHDNAISKIASQANEFRFYNHQVDKNAEVLDEELLPDYKRILDKPGKKLIVLRLIGTHFDYYKRYPESFNKFDTVESKSKKKTLENQFDNAVLYNDFIVHEIINELKSRNQKSAMLYLPDHGENIYDDGTDFFGRSEEILTEPMFTIPFIFWNSKSFQFPEDFEYKPSRPFTADYTLESLAHIFGVQHKTMQNSKSIFSTTFIPEKRLIVGGKDFDTYFKD